MSLQKEVYKIFNNIKEEDWDNFTPEEQDALTKTFKEAYDLFGKPQHEVSPTLEGVTVVKAVAATQGQTAPTPAASEGIIARLLNDVSPQPGGIVSNITDPLVRGIANAGASGLNTIASIAQGAANVGRMQGGFADRGGRSVKIDQVPDAVTEKAINDITTGIDYAAKGLREKAAQIAPTRSKRMEEIDSAGDALQWGVHSVLETAPLMAQTILGAWALKGLGLSTSAASFASSYLSSLGMVRQANVEADMEKTGKLRPGNPGIEAAISIPYALIETGLGVTPQKFIASAEEKAAAKNMMARATSWLEKPLVEISKREGRIGAAGRLARWFVDGLPGEAIGEGAEELFQGILEIATPHFANKPTGKAIFDTMKDLGDPNKAGGLFESFALGTVAGGAFGGGRYIYENVAKRMAPEVEDPELFNGIAAKAHQSLFDGKDLDSVLADLANEINGLPASAINTKKDLIKYKTLLEESVRKAMDAEAKTQEAIKKSQEPQPETQPTTPEQPIMGEQPPQDQGPVWNHPRAFDEIMTDLDTALFDMKDQTKGNLMGRFVQHVEQTGDPIATAQYFAGLTQGKIKKVFESLLAKWQIGNGRGSGSDGGSGGLAIPQPEQQPHGFEPPAPLRVEKTQQGQDLIKRLLANEDISMVPETPDQASAEANRLITILEDIKRRKPSIDLKEDMIARSKKADRKAERKEAKRQADKEALAAYNAKQNAQAEKDQADILAQRLKVENDYVLTHNGRDYFKVNGMLVSAPAGKVDADQVRRDKTVPGGKVVSANPEQIEKAIRSLSPRSENTPPKRKPAPEPERGRYPLSFRGIETTGPVAPDRAETKPMAKVERGIEGQRMTMPRANLAPVKAAEAPDTIPATPGEFKIEFGSTRPAQSVSKESLGQVANHLMKLPTAKLVPVLNSLFHNPNPDTREGKIRAALDRKLRAEVQAAVIARDIGRIRKVVSKIGRYDPGAIKNYFERVSFKDERRIAPAIRNITPPSANPASTNITQKTPVVGPRTDQAKGPKGTVIDVEYRVVDAGKIKTEKKTSSSQNLDRETVQSELQINAISKNPDRRLISDYYGADQGTPIVVESETTPGEYELDGGNGRTLGVQKAYELGNAEEYRNILIAEAAKFGVNPETVRSMEKPMLVRVRKTVMTPEQRQKWVIELNQSDKLATTATEDSGSDMVAIRQAIHKFVPSESGDIDTDANHPFVRSFFEAAVPKTEIAKYINPKTGRLTVAGEQRIQNALFQAAYGARELTRILAESTDNDIKTIIKALIQAMPKMVGNNAKIEAGDLFNISISQDIGKAAVEIERLRKEGKSVRQMIEDSKRQPTFFGTDSISDNVFDLMLFLDTFKGNRYRKIVDLINGFNSAVQKTPHEYGSPNQPAMFSDGAPPTSRDILEDQFKAIGFDPAKEERNAQKTLGDIYPGGSEESRKAPEDGGTGKTGSRQGEGSGSLGDSGQRNAERGDNQRRSGEGNDQRKDAEEPSELDSIDIDDAFKGVFEPEGDYTATPGKPKEPALPRATKAIIEKSLELKLGLLPNSFMAWAKEVLRRIGAKAKPFLMAAYNRLHQITPENAPTAPDAVAREYEQLIKETGIVISLKTAREAHTEIVDPGFLDAALGKIKDWLKPHQLQGVAKAVTSMEKHGSFLLADGTGAGKTSQILATAEYFRKKGLAVVVIVPNKQIIDGSYKNDAKGMGVDGNVVGPFKGGDIQGDKITLSTYYYLDAIISSLANQGKPYVAIFDESQALMNVETTESTRGKLGVELAEGAQASMFVTATPEDKPQHLAYLADVHKYEGKEIEEFYRDLGMIPVQTRDTEGNDVVKWVVNPAVGIDTVNDNIQEMFDRITKRGKMVKREIDMSPLVVKFKGVTLSSETLAKMDEIYAFIMGGKNKIPKAMKKAIALMHQRRQQEVEKIPYVVESVKRALENGKQAVIFMGRVSESTVKRKDFIGPKGQEVEVITELMRTDATSKLLREALKKEGIEDVVELHSKAETSKSESIDQFQTAKAKVIISTVQSGGAGVNMDDIRGDRPRSLIIMTAPFSGIENVQAVGRVWRMNTKSIPEITYLFSNHSVDDWNAAIIQTKMQTLGATVEGEIRTLDVDPTKIDFEPDVEDNYVDMVDKPMSGVPDSAWPGLLGVGQRRPSWPRDTMTPKLPGIEIEEGVDYGREENREKVAASVRRNYGTILGNAIAADIQRNSGVNLLGKEVRSSADLALIAQIYRDPRWETYRLIYVSNGKVVGETAITSMLPGVASAIIKGETQSAMIQRIKNDLHYLKADGFYMLHNHPSGKAKPSRADIDLTNEMAKNFGELKSHVIIDTNQWARIPRPDIKSAFPYFLNEEKWGAKGPRENPSITNAVLGKKIMNDRELAQAYADLKADKNQLVLIGRSQAEVSGIMSISISDAAENASRLGAIIRRFARSTGSQDVIGVTSMDNYTPSAVKIAKMAIENGYLLDMVFGDSGISPTVISTYANENIVRSPSLYFGTNIDAGGRLVSEESGAYSASNVKPDSTLIKLPIELPEWLELVKEINEGKYPIVREKITRNNALGVFKSTQGEKGKGQIAIRADVFWDKDHAAWVTAHELGHMIDWLPDKFMKRGNLLGRLAVLKEYLKNTLVGIIGTNKDIRKELIALTQAVRPYDPKADPKHAQYRQSAVELYAEGFAVIATDPARARREIPLFYDAFFTHLDKKPAVAKAYNDIQAKIQRGSADVLQKREERLRAGIEEAEKAYADRRKQDARRGLLEVIRQHVIDRNSKIYEYKGKVKAAGVEIDPEKDPVYAVEELAFTTGEISGWLDDMAEVKADIDKAGLSWTDLDIFLFFERVMHEKIVDEENKKRGRAFLANPEGHNPETAAAGLKKLESDLGQAKFKELQIQAEKFRETYKYVWNRLREAQILPNDIWALLDKNKYYATFQVVHYLKNDHGVDVGAQGKSSGVKRQIGTFQSVAGAGTATVENGIALLKNINRTIAAKKVVAFLEKNNKHLGGDAISEPEYVYVKRNGRGRKEPSERAPIGKKVLTFMHQGKLVGKIVDEYVAKSFEKNPKEGELIARTLGVVNRFFRAVFTTRNPGFMLFNLVRDFQRTYKNLPGASLAKTFEVYAKTWDQAKDFGFGNADELVSQMKKNKMLIVTENRQHADQEEREIDYLIRRFNAGDKVNTSKNPIVRLWNWLEGVGSIAESWSKLAGYQYLSEKFPEMSQKEIAYKVRNLIGSPNFMRQGQAYNLLNNVFLFSNAFKEGMRSDTEVMRQSPAAYAWKTAKMNIIPKMMLYAMAYGLAAAGYDEWKKWLDGISDYDKTQFNIIPLGWMEGKKSVYMRLPQDEMGRFFSGLLFNLANTQSVSDFAKVGEFAAGQVPNISPALEIGWAWISYLSGRNPYSLFRQRNVMDQNTFNAGGTDAFSMMVQHTANTAGLGILYRFPTYDEIGERGLLEKAVNFPVMQNLIGRFIKVSDAGIRDKIDALVQKEKAKDARETLIENAAIVDYMKANGATKSRSAAAKVFNQVAKENGIKFDGAKDKKDEFDGFYIRWKNLAERGIEDPYAKAMKSVPKSMAKKIAKQL